VLGAVAGTGVATAAAVYNSAVFASDGVLAPTKMPWDFEGYLTTYDAGAIRRGHQVYSQVCASCHGLRAIAYRNLVGVCYSEEEAKAMAEDVEFADGPNDEGEMFDRPGKLSDYFPSPYPNEEAARFANNGAYPPDLSLITKARVGGADYVFALLTGYKDVPAGLQPRDTQYYNPYFPGGWIGMPQPINEGAVEYEDGTSPTVTQMAKDVCVFLTWAAEPEADERKLMGFKMMSALTVLFGFTWWYKRRTWSVIKNRRLVIV
jgi:ubiquinol-cytochrome c reductase cytochrome c1 subunit